MTQLTRSAGLMILTAGAAFGSIGHSIVAVDNGRFQPNGQDAYTFRLVVNITGDPPDDWLSTSINANLFNGRTFYQDPFGSDPVNPAYFSVFPSVEWDTYFTLPSLVPNSTLGGSVSTGDGPTVTPTFISYVWYDTANTGNGDWVILQMTILQPAGAPAITLTPSGTVVGTIAGASGTTQTPTPLTSFDFTLYEVPEPATLSLIGMLALLGIKRR